MKTSENVEILVHVTAPCRAVDDVQYRALAQAYLAFEPTSETRLVSRTRNTMVSSSPLHPSASYTRPYHAPILSSEATQLPSSPPRPPYFSPEPSFQSVQLSFRSVWDNINSPGLGGPAQEIVPSSQPQAQTQLTQDSWKAPPSVIGDSQPVKDISLAEFSSPSRLFEHLACQFESQDASNSQELSHVEDKEDEAVLVTSGDSPPTCDSPPELASSARIIISTPFSCLKQPAPQSSPPDQVIQETPCQPPRKHPLLSLPSHAGSEPLPPKRHKRSASISQSRSLARSRSDINPLDTPDIYRPIRPPNERHLSYLNLLEIRPSGPPVSSTELTPADLLTPKLRQLARQLNLSKRFHPVEQRRKLQPFERGYWALDWTGWRPTLRERAWHFLTDYILDGFAGWGVWCKRAEDWSWLKVYCWGHVVGHVYLALYLASERALKTEAARWVDGAGDVVVVTNGHENSESGESMEDG